MCQLSFPDKKIEVEKRDRHPKARVKKHVIGAPYVIRLEGESLADLSRKYDISESKLKKYNDLRDNVLYDNQPIFLKRKAKKGAASTHTVKEGETPYSISQDHGVRYKNFLKRNRLDENTVFKGGEVVLLKGKKK